jgi:hypothetical protein
MKDVREWRYSTICILTWHCAGVRQTLDPGCLVCAEYPVAGRVDFRPRLDAVERRRIFASYGIKL